MVLSLSLLFLALAVSVNAATFNVLVTGYGPFLNFSTNPSSEVATFLHGRCETLRPDGFQAITLCFEGWNLTVDAYGASTVSRKLEESGWRSRWSAVIHLGLESFAKGLVVETVGANILASDPSKEIVPNGDSVLPTSAPVAFMRLTELIRQVHQSSREPMAPAKKPRAEEWSRDAGTYYCNECLYRTLYATREHHVLCPLCRRMLIPVIFVHLPMSEVTPIEVDARFIMELAAQIVAPTTLDA